MIFISASHFWYYYLFYAATSSEKSTIEISTDIAT